MNTTEEQTNDNSIPFEAAPQYQIQPEQNNVPLSYSDNRQTFSNALADFGVFALSVLLILIIPGIGLLGYVGFKYLSKQTVNLEKDPMAIVVNLIAIVPAHLLTLLAVWAVATRNGSLPFWQSLKFKSIPATGYLLCFLATFAMFLVAAGILYLLPEQENIMVQMLKSSPAAMIAAAFMATFTAPIVEETVYRGVLYQGFENWLGKAAAVSIVTLLFALVHVPQYWPSIGTILVILLLSLFLTLLRARTDNILPCFVIHTIFNGVQSIGLVYEAVFGPIKAPSTPDPALFLPF